MGTCRQCRTEGGQKKNAKATPVPLIFTHQTWWFFPLSIKLMLFLVFFHEINRKNQI